MVEEFLVDNNLCLFNDDTPTYLHPATGSLTSIDLTLSSPNTFLDFNWQVEEDQWGSDHYPIILQNQFYSPEDRQPRWQFHKANWPQFQNMCSIITPDLFEGSDDPLKLFTETVYDIASTCIPKLTPTSKK